MKLLLLTTFVATVCYVNAGKTQRLLAAALNGGLIGGVNGVPLGGLNAGGLANVPIPRLMPAGLNPPMVAGGGAAFFGQPQFAQFVPGLPAFALPAQPVANLYPVPAVNALPYVAVPQMAPVNPPPQQPLTGVTGGAVQQQLPAQPDQVRRFRRQVMNPDNTLKTTVDTQIPAPAETMTPTLCDEGQHEED